MFGMNKYQIPNILFFMQMWLQPVWNGCRPSMLRLLELMQRPKSGEILWCLFCINEFAPSDLTSICYKNSQQANLNGIMTNQSEIGLEL